jgi:hypothetical protein
MTQERPNGYVPRNQKLKKRAANTGNEWKPIILKMVH